MPPLRLLREADADARREGRRLFASRVAPTLEAAMCELKPHAIDGEAAHVRTPGPRPRGVGLGACSAFLAFGYFCLSNLF